MVILRRDYVLGERKYIKFQATSCDDMPVVITAATWKLLKKDTVVQHGTCKIDGDIFMAMLEPESVGDFMLEVEYTITPESRKVRVHIHVS